MIGFKGGASMKKRSVLILVLILVFATFSLAAAVPIRIFVEDKQVKNNDDYIIKDNKVYVSEDALKNDFGFNVFYDKDENRIRLYDVPKMQFEARSSLFENFGDIYEPATPDEVANLWALGVKKRNGAFQYLVLSKQLKEEFKVEAEKNGRLGWVTGFSSPWVEDYKITKEKINDLTWKYNIVFNITTSTPIEEKWNATLTVEKQDNLWRIINITKDFDIM